VKDYSIIKNRKTKQIPKRTSFPLQWKVWKTMSFHDLPQNADSLNRLEKQKLTHQGFTNVSFFIIQIIALPCFLKAQVTHGGEVAV
jgi:hypothetical protein